MWLSYLHIANAIHFKMLLRSVFKSDVIHEMVVQQVNL